MPRVRTETGEKNLIGVRLKQLQEREKFSQRDLAYRLQSAGLDVDKNVITRIETNKRYVTDLEIQDIARFFRVSYEYLIDGVEPNPPVLFHKFHVHR